MLLWEKIYHLTKCALFIAPLTLAITFYYLAKLVGIFIFMHMYVCKGNRTYIKLLILIAILIID